MTIKEQAISLCDILGIEVAITKTKEAIVNTEQSFGKMGYTPQDLRNVKEWKLILQALYNL